MVRAPSSIISFIRHSSAGARLDPAGQLRNLATESKDGDCGGNYRDVIHEICLITRRRPRWEHTLLSEFPSLNFSDPCLFQAYLKHQNNAFLSLRFFNWLCSHGGFSPDQSSCNALFDVLVDAKACNAAKSLLDCAGFTPEPSSLECYIRRLSRGGMVEEAVNIFGKLKNVGFCPSVATWNASLSACLKAGRTDLVWTLYEQMMVSDVIANIDVETIGYLIQAYCDDNKVSEGYQLLRQILEDGLCPDNVVFNTLISGFCKDEQHARVSELLHIMIAKGRSPDIFTYQEIINGLLKGRKNIEGFRIFNDLKDRGYFPDRVMYTTIIKGLCDMGWLGEARKLWFEMIRKGLLPNEYTYSVMINKYCRIGDFDEARKLYKEMCDKGYEETTVTCNTMISGLCFHGRTDEAQRLFEEMSQKGIVCDIITYNSLISGLFKKGKLAEAKQLFNELLAKGLEPSTSSITTLIKRLCEVGDTQEAIRFWKDMVCRNWEPTVSTYDYIVTGLCEQGYFTEAMEWLLEMLNRKLKPQKQTFEILIQCLLKKDKLDNVFVVLDQTLTIGYTLQKNMIESLVRKFGGKNFNFAETCLERILDRNL
ncbi:pentatricopeptide repeat-containing protein At5g18950-like [Prosopis cineraria]|uniref:pentatricopeptide repeat-containing protein At5g18950-like n=1 Tax=Prosopis cineraria TaxID=364024 RepID=UPI00240F8E53|nr:pentatricopeptide repeat-containing protein At5g18950-like [Prosopis cineraria]XP_054807019.1 pentatricopeptide repeat-containing protein At5g18950-like [Prosopis cineraria]